MGVALKVTLFDFSANDFSRQFECSCFSAEAFVNRCMEIIWGKESEVSPAMDSPHGENVSEPDDTEVSVLKKVSTK